MSTKNQAQILVSRNVVWGARGIGKVIKQSPRQVYRLFETGSLEGVVKIGGRLAGTKEALLANFPQPTRENDDGQE